MGNMIDKIDKDMLPLVTAMNNTGWIETVSSCQGHPKSKYFKKPYVAFSCKASKIKELCKILNQIEQQEAENLIMFDLSVVHNNEVHGCQEDARRGWLALDLHIETDSKTVKIQVFNILTDLFNQATTP